MSVNATLNPNADYASSTYAVYTAGSFSGVLSDGSDASYAYGTDNFETVDTWSVECECSDMPSAVSIDSVTVYVRAKQGGGVVGTNHVYGRVYTTGASYNHSTPQTLGATITEPSFTWITNPATAAAWTPAQVNAARFGAYYDVTGFASPGARVSPEIIKVWVVVAYTPTPATVAVTRHLLSTDLWFKRRPEYYGQFLGNMDVLNVPMLGAVDLEHTMGTHATGVGWEDETWQRRAFAVHGLNIDLNAMTVGARIKDQRPIRCLVRDLAWSDKASGTLLDGIARFATPGAIFTHTRASEHSFTNPVGETEVATVDVPAYGLGGLYMLSASAPRVANRYYVSNNTGVRTLSGPQGSFQCEVNLAAVSAVANQTVAYCYHDASNWWWLYWDPVTATDRWVFEIRAAGVTYRAIKTATPSSATWYQIGARWTGAQAENGDAAYTLSIFIDRVKGTDAAAAAAMTEAASSNFDFGSKAAAGTDQLNGQIRKIHSYQDVLTDTEMMRAI